MNPHGRKPAVRERVVRDLRKVLVEGRLRPGQRLPSQRELARKYGISLVTAGRVVAQLIREGFLETRDRSGTFIAEKQSPSLFALVLPSDPADVQHLWSRFYATMVNQVPVVARARHCQIKPFFSMDLGVKAPEYPHLLDLVESHRLAGLIFASNPYHLIGTPVLEQPGIARVALMPEQQFPNIPVISYDSFFPRALDWLAEQGCRRIAVLMQHDELPKFPLVAAAHARGLTIRPEWLLPMTPHLCDAAAAYTRLLMTAPPAQRVDGLLIGDDNYVEPALAGLKAAGIKLGREIHVLAHANFPWAGEHPPGVVRLGYDTATVLEICLDLLAAQRAGRPVPPVTTIGALFENEVEQQKQQPTAADRRMVAVTTGEQT